MVRGSWQEPQSWFAAGTTIVAIGNRMIRGNRNVSAKGIQSRFATMVAIGDGHDSWQSCFVAVVVRGNRDDIGARAIATLVPMYTKSLPSQFVAIVAMLQSRSVTIVVRGSCGVFLWELRPHTPNEANVQ